MGQATVRRKKPPRKRTFKKEVSQLASGVAGRAMRERKSRAAGFLSLWMRIASWKEMRYTISQIILERECSERFLGGRMNARLCIDFSFFSKIPYTGLSFSGEYSEECCSAMW